MQVNIEVLLNGESDRYFLFNIDKGGRSLIPVRSAYLFKSIVGEDNVKSFDNIKELNKHVKDSIMIHRGEFPKTTPGCHKFFAKDG